MKNLSIYKLILTAFAVVVLVFPAVSSAVMTSRNVETEQTTVTASDLNLARQEGIVTLYKRLKHAAVDVCGKDLHHSTAPRFASLEVKSRYNKCVDDALENAVQSINNQSLTELHSQ